MNFPKIEKIFYLDSGHNGDTVFYPIQDSCVEFIKNSKIAIEIWISPYQMRNPNKICATRQKEIDLLSAKLEGMVKVEKIQWDKPPSLDVHFDVLSQFIAKYTEQKAQPVEKYQ